MVKKKFSGQTITIIILTALLLITIVFGGVYAYYSARSKKVMTGRIVMANLKINMESGEPGSSDKSEIVISNGYQIVPGQPLENTPLVVRNYSTTSIYLVIVYQINAYVIDEDTKEKTYIVDEFKNPVLGLGVEYVNSIFPKNNSTTTPKNTEWIDFVFVADAEDSNADEVVIDSSTNQKCNAYRCLVSTKSYGFTGEDGEGIVVIGENEMSLAGAMGSEYQGSNIAFTFQAYAIAANSEFGLTEEETSESWCQKIVSATYHGQGYRFLNID